MRSRKRNRSSARTGADGQVQKTPLPGAAPAPKQQEQPSRRGGGRRGGGAVKETIVENKVEDLKDYMEKVAALVHEYVPPNPQKIQAVQTAAGNMSTQPSGSGAVLSLKDYNKPGDLPRHRLRSGGEEAPELQGQLLCREAEGRRCDPGRDLCRPA